MYWRSAQNASTWKVPCSVSGAEAAVKKMESSISERSAVCDPRPAPPMPVALLQSLRLNPVAFERIRLSVGRRLESICSLLELSPARPAKLDLPDWVRFPAADQEPNRRTGGERR